jgi:hypothetical protein
MQPQDPNQQPPQPTQPEYPQQSASPQEQYQAPPEAQPTVNDTPNGKPVSNPLESMQPGEKIICEIKRHPIGLLGVYASIGLVFLLIAVLGYGIGPSIFTNVDKSQVYSYTSLIMLVALAFSAIAVLVAHVVYWGNRWVVTSDSVTQITQISLFSKQSSQLSMGNLEDVTAEQNGILAHMFNYGVLKAETAGEHSKFRFIYCPNPNYYAQQILGAREAFEQQHYRNVPNQTYPAPSGPPQ